MMDGLRDRELDSSVTTDLLYPPIIVVILEQWMSEEELQKPVSFEAKIPHRNPANTIRFEPR